MDMLIPIINKLQDVFNAIGQSPIDLPQIVVIGSQSSGKSSVLENIVGRDFLPRGTGIVTRRPLVLQLYNNSISVSNNINNDSSIEKNEINDNEYGEFLHLPGQKFTDFQLIRKEIEKETERITGKNKGISNKSINLKIYSPNILNLTLVDLPGITKVPVGDQPLNIEEQIKDMCISFISNPNSIILAVTPANTDLANSDSLKLAKHVDPEGLRTIGVLTKLDLMDQGTDALDMLNNKIIPLKKGFVGVINRSQKDINDNISIRECLKKEKLFFNNHISYRNSTISSKLGTIHLTKSLNNILMYHIRDCLPDIKRKIQSLLTDVELEMNDMGTPTSSLTKTDLGGLLLRLISNFTCNFCNSLEGKKIHDNPYNMFNTISQYNTTNNDNYDSNSMIQSNELYGGARINYIFNEIFVNSIINIDPFAYLTDDEIRTTIRNANGPRQSLFVPEISFELLVKKQIKRLASPALQCLDMIYNELQNIISTCETPDFIRFNELKKNIMNVFNNMLKNCFIPTQDMIHNLIKIELAYINTNHPDFIGGSRAVAKLMENLQMDSIQHSDLSNTIPSNDYTNETNYINNNNNNNNNININGKIELDQEQDINNTINNTNNKFMSLIFPNKNKIDSTTDTNDKRNNNNDINHTVKLPDVPISMKQTEYPPTDREKIETEIIKSLLASYFDIVRKNIIDLVPKTIMYFLVNHMKDNIQNELVSNLYKEDSLENLLKETDEMNKKRDNCYEMKILLQKAIDIVNEVRDFNLF